MKMPILSFFFFFLIAKKRSFREKMCTKQVSLSQYIAVCAFRKHRSQMSNSAVPQSGSAENENN